MSLFDTLIGSTANASSNNTSANNQSQAEQKNTNTNANTNTSGSQQTSSNQNTTQNTNSSQNTQQNTSQNTNQNTSENTNQNTSGGNASASKGSNVTSTLDAGTIAALGQLLPTLISSVASPNGGAALTQQIASQFLQKSQTPAISASDIAGQESAAVTSFNQNEKVDINKLQNSIGSKNNTYSALVEQKGQQDLASTLAGIVANASATNAQIGDSQLNDAIQAIVAGSGIGQNNVQNLLGLVSALKGATTTESTDQSVTGSTSQNVSGGSTQSVVGQNTGSSTGISDTSTTAQTIAQILEAINNSQSVNQSSVSAEDTAAVASGTSSSNTAGKQGSGLLGMLF